MEQFQQILQSISNNLVDVLIYTAIAVVALVGLIKCVFPLRYSAKCLRRAVRTLDKLPVRDATRPVWQNELFMGKKMRGAWRRFLNNAEQLDARGMTCNVAEYINDDSAIYACGNIPLGELIPGLLTSLGILGTFIGLMRGLGGLDVSDAAKTMESIPAMIGGMTFAFATSIAGISCSLLFNLLNRMAMGSATRALDEFTDVFTELVMQNPLDGETQAICQREDQTTFLRRAVADLGDHMAQSVSGAVENSLTPVTQAMNSFILGQTQAQLEGVSAICSRFVDEMNESLSDQLLQLGKTMSQISRSQQGSFDLVNRSMATAAGVMDHLTEVQRVTSEIATKFDDYVHILADSREKEDEFTALASDVVQSLSRAARDQASSMEDIKRAQAALQTSMSDWALRSKQTMQLICDRADETGKSSAAVAREMKDSGKVLKDSYAAFVDNISAGLSRTMGMFDKNMTELMRSLERRVQEIGKTDNGKTVSTLSAIQDTLSTIEKTLQSTRREG